MLFAVLSAGATVVSTFKLFKFFASDLFSDSISLFAPNLNHPLQGPPTFSK